MDKTRIFEAAGKFAAKGQLDKAVKEYQRILDEDPKDVRALQKLAEIHQKAGKNREAAELMLRVAEGYSDQGFFLKSVAVYKQVLKLGTDLVDVNLKLAQIYQQLGLVSDATQQYQLVANYYDKAGNVRESLAALRKMVDLDPDNVESRRKLAELYSRQDMVGEAVTEFRRAAAYLKKANRAEDYLKTMDRIGQLVPDDAGVAKELAQAFLARGEAKRALAKLQVCFRQNPRDVDTLQMLARAFQELGQTAKTVSVYRELVHVLAEQGQEDQRRRVLETILVLVPGDPEATEALQQRGPAGAAAAVLVPPAPEIPARSAAASASPPAPPRPAAIVPPPPPGPVPATTIVPAGALPASVQKVLTEVDVYLKYNLLPKASEHLRKALVEAPDFIAVQEKRLVVSDRLGQQAESIDALARLVALARGSGDLDRERTFLQDLGGRAPDHPLVTEAAAAAELDELDVADVIIEPDEVEAEGEPVVEGVPADEEILDVEFAPSSAPSGPPQEAAPLDAGIRDDESVIVDEEEEGAAAALGLALDDHAAVPGGAKSDLDPFELDGDTEDEAVVLDDEPSVDAAPPLQLASVLPDFGLGETTGRRTRPPADAPPVDDADEFGAFGLDVPAPVPAPATIAPAATASTDSGVNDDDALSLVDDSPGPVVAVDAHEPGAVPARAEDDAGPGAVVDDEGRAPEDEAPVVTQQAPSAEAVGTPEAEPSDDEDEFVPVPGPRQTPRAASAAAEEETVPALAVPPDSAPAPVSVPPLVAAPAEPDFAAELDEAEFLIAQDLREDARFALEAILAQSPANERARAMLLSMDPDSSVPPREPTMPPPREPTMPPPAASAADEGFDLARELADEFDFLEPARATSGGEAGMSVSDMLKGMPTAPDATHEDAQTHYDLGIAYKEMGMLDEAIQEFEVALKATGRRRVIDCLNMIGMCLLEKGEAPAALASFTKALKTPGITLEASKELHYEIGRCQETIGDARKALDHFGRVYKADPSFRDVKAAVTRLQARLKGATSPKPAASPARPATGRPSQPAPAAAAKKAVARPPAPPTTGAAGKPEAPATAEPKPTTGGRGGKIGYV